MELECLKVKHDKIIKRIGSKIWKIKIEIAKLAFRPNWWSDKKVLWFNFTIEITWLWGVKSKLMDLDILWE